MRPRNGGIKRLAPPARTRRMHRKWISIRPMVLCLMMRLNCYRMMALMLAESMDLRPRTLRIILLMMENYESSNFILKFLFFYFLFLCVFYYTLMYMVDSSFFSSLFTLTNIIFCFI